MQMQKLDLNSRSEMTSWAICFSVRRGGSSEVSAILASFLLTSSALLVLEFRALVSKSRAMRWSDIVFCSSTSTVRMIFTCSRSLSDDQSCQTTSRSIQCAESCSKEAGNWIDCSSDPIVTLLAATCFPSVQRRQTCMESRLWSWRVFPCVWGKGLWGLTIYPWTEYITVESIRFFWMYSFCRIARKHSIRAFRGEQCIALSLQLSAILSAANASFLLILFPRAILLCGSSNELDTVRCHLFLLGFILRSDDLQFSSPLLQRISNTVLLFQDFECCLFQFLLGKDVWDLFPHDMDCLLYLCLRSTGKEGLESGVEYLQEKLICSASCKYLTSVDWEDQTYIYEERSFLIMYLFR